jgi:excisionase family DNA binding protein
MSKPLPLPSALPEGQPTHGANLAPSANHPSLLTADELAERWQVSKAQVYRLARAGRVPTLPIGRYYRFRLASIEAWEMEHEGRVG